MTLLSALYIKGSIQRVFDICFDYNAKALQGVLQNTFVTLPFMDAESDELDWEYMEKYISDIERKYVARLKEEMDRKIEILNKLIH